MIAFGVQYCTMFKKIALSYAHIHFRHEKIIKKYNHLLNFTYEHRFDLVLLDHSTI